MWKATRAKIVRGGIDMMVFVVPFVWLSNQFSNTGLLLKTTAQSDNTQTAANEVNNGNGFVADPNAQSSIGNAGSSFEANLIDKDQTATGVKSKPGPMPNYPVDINATFDAICSKTLNNVFYQDVNLTACRCSRSGL